MVWGSCTKNGEEQAQVTAELYEDNEWLQQFYAEEWEKYNALCSWIP